MPTISRDSVNIYYEVHGSSGPFILLTHGYAATSAMWNDQIAVLSKEYRLVLWDMRGHGKTDYPEEPQAYSEAATVDDMAAILDAVGAETAIVGGLSLGGYMSMAFYGSYPDRVGALLIIDTGPGMKNDEARDAWNNHALEIAEQLRDQGLPLLRQWSPEMAKSEHRDVSGLVHSARGMLTQKNANVMYLLPEIKVPSIVLIGANDEPYLNAADYMERKIPDCKKVVIPEAGHSSNIDQPEIFNRELLTFLASL